MRVEASLGREQGEGVGHRVMTPSARDLLPPKHPERDEGMFVDPRDASWAGTKTAGFAAEGPESEGAVEESAVKVEHPGVGGIEAGRKQKRKSEVVAGGRERSRERASGLVALRSARSAACDLFSDDAVPLSLRLRLSGRESRPWRLGRASAAGPRLRPRAATRPGLGRGQGRHRRRRGRVGRVCLHGQGCSPGLGWRGGRIPGQGQPPPRLRRGPIGRRPQLDRLSHGRSSYEWERGRTDTKWTRPGQSIRGPPSSPPAAS